MTTQLKSVASQELKNNLASIFTVMSKQQATFTAIDKAKVAALCALVGLEIQSYNENDIVLDEAMFVEFFSDPVQNKLLLVGYVFAIIQMINDGAI